LKDRQHNGQKKKDKWKINDIQSATQKTKDQAVESLVFNIFFNIQMYLLFFSQEDLYKASSRGQQMSTPLKGSDNRHDNRQKNRVHFSDNPSLRTDAEINQQTFSPIPQQLQQQTDFSLSRNFPFGLNFSQNSPHDSMIVHGPMQDSLNVTGFSELDDSIVNSNSSGQSDRNENSESLRKCGGGQLSPPGGGSSQRVPSQGYYSSQGFRQGMHGMDIFMIKCKFKFDMMIVASFQDYPA